MLRCYLAGRTQGTLRSPDDLRSATHLRPSQFCQSAEVTSLDQGRCPKCGTPDVIPTESDILPAPSSVGLLPLDSPAARRAAPQGADALGSPAPAGEVGPQQPQVVSPPSICDFVWAHKPKDEPDEYNAQPRIASAPYRPPREKRHSGCSTARTSSQDADRAAPSSPSCAAGSTSAGSQDAGSGRQQETRATAAWPQRSDSRLFIRHVGCQRSPARRFPGS